LVSLFQREYDRAGNGIGNAHAVPKIFERIPKGIQSGEHIRSRFRQRGRIAPFRDDAIAALAGLDDVGMLEPGPVVSDGPVSVEEFSFTSGLDPKSHYVVSIHTRSSRLRLGQILAPNQSQTATSSVPLVQKQGRLGTDLKY
jgi:hypothetical protein